MHASEAFFVTTDEDEDLEAQGFDPSAPAFDPMRSGRTPRVAWTIAFAAALAVTAAGLASGAPAHVVAGTAIFLFVAVGNDVRAYRIPNLLTLPALAAALLMSPWCGATHGPLHATLGVATGFALLFLPYAVGGIGAGDVKALMALGAWLGPATTLGATAWALLAAASFGVTLLSVRGELIDLLRRWGRILLATLALRRVVYEPPSLRSRADGIPFAAALSVGVALQWFGGSPW